LTASGIITLLTDFGDKDPFVGVMKGQILGRFEKARIVDLTHQIAPQSVSEASFWLERSYRWFPEGTVHVAVVDPGVGTERAILAASISGHYFLAPDNGLLGSLLEEAAFSRVHAVDLQKIAALGIRAQSSTFHGRDIFAPLAAEIASGRLELGALGAEAMELEMPASRTADLAPGRIEGRVVTIDRFGNLITNVTRAQIKDSPKARVRVRELVLPLVHTYGDVQAGEYLAVIDAFEALEIAQRNGSAAAALGIGVGEPIVVELD
jgi:S-adenosylmethionine hydrolase